MQRSFAYDESSKNLKYCMINMKIDKACRAINDMMKKNYSLNKI